MSIIIKDKTTTIPLDKTFRKTARFYFLFFFLKKNHPSKKPTDIQLSLPCHTFVSSTTKEKYSHLLFFKKYHNDNTGSSK